MHMGKREFNYAHPSNLQNLLGREFLGVAVTLQSVSSGLSGDAKILRLSGILEALLRDRLVFIIVIIKLQNFVL